MSDTLTPEQVAEGLRAENSRLRHDLRESCIRAVQAEAQRDTLARFKAWVHDYLDAKGVPTHPDGPHGKEGCRIGDRMDFVFAEMERLAAENARAAGIAGEKCPTCKGSGGTGYGKFGPCPDCDGTGKVAREGGR